MWWRLAWPVGLGILMRNVYQLVDLAFLGHLGTQYLAAAGIANMFIVITSAWMWKSFGAALNTLCAQARGAGAPYLQGTYLSLSTLVTVVACLPIAVAWQYTADVMTALGFDAQASALAGRFATWFTIGLLPTQLFQNFASYLQNIGVVYAVLVINIVMVGLNAALNYLLIYGWDGFGGLGFIGSPIATSVTAWASCLALAAYVLRTRALVGNWRACDGEVRSPVRLRTFLAQAAPAALGNLLEDLQLQVMVYYASQLSTAAIATHNGFLYFFFVITSFMYGSVKATTIRIGYYLGARNVRMAKRVAVLHLVVTTAAAIVIAGCVLGADQWLGRIFSSDPAVWALAGVIAVPVGLGYLALSLFFTAMAVLSGQGRPGIVAVAFIVGAWGVAVPLGYGMTYVWHRGLLGIWQALVAGYATITVIATLPVLTSNWAALAEAAAARSRPLTTGSLNAGGGGGGDSEASAPEEPTLAAAEGLVAAPMQGV